MKEEVRRELASVKAFLEKIIRGSHPLCLEKKNDISL